LDRSPKFALLPPVVRAARLIYLNKTCYNGLFRVNTQGQFNVPFGCYKNPVIADPAIIRAISSFLATGSITLRNQDFQDAVLDAGKGDFVYFDPPYDPVSDSASFTGYSLNGFDKSEQERLRDLCDLLTLRGVHVMVSNSDTPFVRDLYSGPNYTINPVRARRAINSDPLRRGLTDELVILNYSAG
jgi:DNA adenine methylase